MLLPCIEEVEQEDAPRRLYGMCMTLEYGSSSTGMIVISNLSPCCNIDDEAPNPVRVEPAPVRDVYFLTCDRCTDYTNYILYPSVLVELCYAD